MPFDLTTLETIKRLKLPLKPEGVLITDLCSNEGVKSRILRVEYKTYLRVFKNVLVFTVKDKKSAKARLIFLALRGNKNYTKKDLVTLAKNKKDPSRYLKLISTYPTRPIRPDNSPVLKDNEFPLTDLELKIELKTILKENFD